MCVCLVFLFLCGYLNTWTCPFTGDKTKSGKTDQKSDSVDIELILSWAAAVRWSDEEQWWKAQERDVNVGLCSFETQINLQVRRGLISTHRWTSSEHFKSSLLCSEMLPDSRLFLFVSMKINWNSLQTDHPDQYLVSFWSKVHHHYELMQSLLLLISLKFPPPL